MGRLHNHRHELFAVALASGQPRCEALVSAGYQPHRGNQNRLAKLSEIVQRVEEIKRTADEVVNVRKLDPGRILTELARVAFACQPVRAAIVTNGVGAVPADQPVLHVTVRLEGMLAKPIEMRLLDDRGALTALMRYDNAPDQPVSMDFSPAIPVDSNLLELTLRRLLADRERHPSQADPHQPIQATGSPS